MADIAQGTAEWMAQRPGKVTASRVADVIAKTKSGPSASRTNYAAQLIAERLTGEPQETFISGPMTWGTEKEPEAKAAYSFMTDAAVDECGFILHPSIIESGASPDGFVGDDGLIECKCPNTNTHIETLLGQSVPGKYITQIQWQLACTGRRWCDFVSFDPRMPADMRAFIKRVYRDDEIIAGLEAEVRLFLTEVSGREDELLRLYRGRAAA